MDHHPKNHVHPTAPPMWSLPLSQLQLCSFHDWWWTKPYPQVQITNANDQQWSPLLKQPTKSSTKHSAPDHISLWRWTWGTCRPATPQRPRTHKHLSWLLATDGSWRMLWLGWTRMKWWLLLHHGIISWESSHAPWITLVNAGNLVNARALLASSRSILARWMLVIRSPGSCWILPKHPNSQQNHELLS